MKRQIFHFLYVMIKAFIEEVKYMMITEKQDFLSLSDDLLFKETFAHPDNRDKLIYFLSCFTEFKEEYLKEVNIEVEYESILTKTKRNDKNLRGDVIIKFANYLINLEAYSTFDNNSLNKSISYIMRIFSTQLDRGRDYNTLESVIQINIVDDVTPRDLISKRIENEIILKGKYENEEILSELFQIKCLRLDTAREMVYDKNNLQQRWLRFIGAKNEEERREIARGDGLLMELDNWCRNYVNDEQTKKIFGEWANYIAEEKGIRKGLQLGIKQEKLDIAKNFLKLNVSKEDISKATGLSLKELKELE